MASNPKDWKMPLYNTNANWPSIEGNDVAGIIALVGEGETYGCLYTTFFAINQVLMMEDRRERFESGG